MKFDYTVLILAKEFFLYGVLPLLGVLLLIRIGIWLSEELYEFIERVEVDNELRDAREPERETTKQVLQTF